MSTPAWEVVQGDCLDVMGRMREACVDSIVTDPPYGLAFMGKHWDHGVPGADFWREALRVAKPGAHLLAFGGTRTFHRLAVAIEDAGWEVRDCLSWLYGSGFPKSHNLDGEWSGWGTALKPAWEPVILARKPLVGTVAANVAAHGTGALNVDGCRIETGDALVRTAVQRRDNVVLGKGLGKGTQVEPLGRWPANLMLDEDAAAALDAQTGVSHSRHSDTPQPIKTSKGHKGDAFGADSARRPDGHPTSDRHVRGGFDDSGGAARFFYCAKASRSEREAGLREAVVERHGEQGQGPDPKQTPRVAREARNTHPTVKPVALMRWLCRLVTPPGGVVLDPFTGSGTTGVAAVHEGFRFVGIEREAQYVEIARARIANAVRP